MCITRAGVPVGRDTGGQRKRETEGGGEGVREEGREAFNRLINKRLLTNIGVSRA